MHVLLDAPLVNVPQPRQELWRQRRQIRGAHVLVHLGRTPSARDRRGHGVETEDPPERELGQGAPRRYQRAKLLDHRESQLVVDARERFAAIERGALAIEETMVVGGKGGVALELAAQKARRQR